MEMVETELVKYLQSELPALNPEQIANGASLIFRQLKHQLDDQDFADLDTVIPESDQLAVHAPEDVRVLSGGINSLNPALDGNQLAQLGQLNTLVGSFQRIGLEPNLVPKFVQFVLNYVQKQGGNQLFQVVEKALKA